MKFFNYLSFPLVVMLFASCDLDKAPSQNNKLEKTAETRIAVDIGIVVSDMTESLLFYRDQIGLEVIAEINTKLIGEGKMVQLKHGASIIKLVKLESSAREKSALGINQAIGLRYITLMVNDISKYVRIVEAAQIPISLPLTELGNGAKIMMCQDPDGNIVEFVQEA